MGSMTRTKRVAMTVTVTWLLLLGYLGITVLQVWETGRSYATQPAEVIVVLGAAQYDGRPSPQLAARRRNRKPRSLRSSVT